MAIITYWNDGKAETGQSMTIAAVATAMALNFNYKILMINTKHNDKSLEYAFEPKNNINGFFTKGKMDIATGLSGVAKAIASNKTSPEIIANYTKIIWKNLELLTEKDVPKEDYDKYIQYIKEIIKLANRYYDIVLVDLEGNPKNIAIKDLLNLSTINVVTQVQNINKLDNFKELKKDFQVFKEKDFFVSLGKYDEKSPKYTKKNVAKYLNVNVKKVFAIPYNTKFATDAPDGKVADYIINFRKAKPPHINGSFIQSAFKQAEELINTIKEGQRKIY